MNPWNQYTLFRLLIFYVAGILLNRSIPTGLHLPAWIWIFFLAVLVALHLLTRKKKAYKVRWIYGPVLGIIMIAFGVEWSRLHDHRSDPKHIIHHYNGKETLLVRLKGDVEHRPNSYKVLAEAIAMDNDSVWLSVKGNVLLYFQKDSLSENLSYGDRLLLYSRLNQPLPPSNPGEFDYRRFLANKNIYHQGFVKRGQWVKTGSGHGNPIVHFALKLRKSFIRIFENHGIGGRDFAVATALIIGMDEYLDNDTRKEFSSAGAMHILCVSGLHVGVIFLVLNSILFFLNRNRYTRMLKVVLLLAGIWFYALLTGLAPSVLRASTMFSFVIIGMSMNRRASIYNSLSASAFVLLLINPFLLREVGFQLSYAAVIAIVSVQPRLYQLWRPENWLLDKMWAITTVSIAAQLGTAPLGLYYFHQFPNYFIITNLLVIPLATLILYSGFLTVILSVVPILSKLVSWMLVIFLKALNYSVTFVDRLPYSSTTGVFISMTEMLILFLVLMAVFRAFMKRRALWLQASLAMMILFLGIGLVRNYYLARQQRIVIYAMRNDYVIDLIQGRNALLLVDSARYSDPAYMDFHVSGHHVRRGINRKNIMVLNDSESRTDFRNTGFQAVKAYPLLAFHKISAFFVDGNTTAFPIDEPIEADLLIVLENYRKPETLLQSVTAGKVIICGKVAAWNAGQWEKACDERGIAYHNIREHGAFVMDL